MHRLRLTAIVLLALGVSNCGDRGENRQKETTEYETAESQSAMREGPVVHVVEIVQMKFVPEVVNISKGDTVKWINRDLVQHDVTELSQKSWTSQPMAASATWQKVFEGSEGYYCSLHLVMKGKVIVDGKDVTLTNPPGISMCDGTTQGAEQVAAVMD